MQDRYKKFPRCTIRTMINVLDFVTSIYDLLHLYFSDSDIRSVLQQAISQINQQTCITFDSKTEHDIDYLTITAGSS